MKKIFFVSMVNLFFLIIFAAGSFAEYPEKNIKLICPYGAGGATDIAARVFANVANEHFLKDISIIVENMPGSSGLKADSYIVRTKADGYTIYCLNTSTARTTQHSPTKIAAFQPIGMYVFDPLVLVVSKDSKYSNLENFLDSSKSKKGTSLCTSGSANLTYLMGRIIENEIQGVKFRYVNANSGSIQIQQLLGGHVDAGFITIGEAYSQLESGNLKGLTYSGDKRHPIFSHIPTLKEKGIDIVIGAGRGIGVSAQTPKDIVDYLANFCGKVINSKVFVEEMEKAGFPVTYKDPENYKEFLMSYEKKITPLAIELGL